MSFVAGYTQKIVQMQLLASIVTPPSRITPGG